MLSLLKRKLYFKNSNQRLLKDCVFIILRDVNIVKKKKNNNHSAEWIRYNKIINRSDKFTDVNTNLHTLVIMRNCDWDASDCM